MKHLLYTKVKKSRNDVVGYDWNGCPTICEATCMDYCSGCSNLCGGTCTNICSDTCAVCTHTCTFVGMGG
jgi:ribosomally synthesized peptide (Cys-rich family)